MGYCTVNNITAKISMTDLLPMLDDLSTGDFSSPSVQATLANMIDINSQLIDGCIANIIDVPVNPPPPLLVAACTIFFCEDCYRRRLTPDEKNPFKSQADMFREQLKDIGTGKREFDLRYPRDFPQGSVTVIPVALNSTTL